MVVYWTRKMQQEFGPKSHRTLPHNPGRSIVSCMLLALSCPTWLGCTGIRTTTMPCKDAVELSDTLNKLNGSKEKTGYWIEYLDSNLNPVPCKKASYGQLAFYWRGQRVLPMGPPKLPLSGVPAVTIDRASLNRSIGPNSVYLLNGVVKMEYRRRTLTRTYKDGILIKEVNISLNGNVQEIVNYTEHYKDNKYTCHIKSIIDGGIAEDYYGVIDGRVKWVSVE